MMVKGAILSRIPFLLVVLTLLSIAVPPAYADRDRSGSSSFSIDSARWSERRSRLTVSGSGKRGETVTVSNADTSADIGSDRVGRSGWSIEIRHPSSVPCRVRAEQSDGQSAERDVHGAPGDCDNGGGTTNTPPVADANGPYSGTAGSAVSFSSAGSADPDGTIDSYSWDFGDGNGSSQANPSHTYAAAGDYTVTLTVTDNSGDSASDVTNATIDAVTPGNESPTANANGPYSGVVGQPIAFSSAGSSDPDGTIDSYAWDFGDGNGSSQANPSHAYAAAGSYTVSLTVTDDQGASDSQDATATISESQPVPDVSINSTSQNGVPGDPVSEQTFVNQSGYRVFAVNDLGMHCGDFDTRISSILPPFNVLHATVIQRGSEPNILSPADGVEVYYSAASNPVDPILSGTNSAGSGPVYSSMVNGLVYKTNFWDVAREAYAPFYPAEPFTPDGVLSLFYPDLPFNILDLGLPMPNVERLYLGDGELVADQQSMPGRFGPYLENVPQKFEAYVVDQPFFINPDFQFGYVSEGVNWYEAPGVPATAFDDYGRENPWPLYRVQAKMGGSTLASVDTVVPISGEANCSACHAAEVDGGNGAATWQLANVATTLDDPQLDVLPLEVSKEYATDINILRLHDEKHGTDLENQTPVVCQQCHYTPALDLAQLGPLAGDVGTLANGRAQTDVRSMSNVMHSHHSSVTDQNGNRLFPDMPAAQKDGSGLVLNAQERRTVLQETCYQCHPGRRTDCLRGAMANGGMMCQDCHGNMSQVGDDFTRGVSPATPGAFELGGDFYTNADQPRVPWANEPGCGSCHTGDAMSNLAGSAGTVTNTVDSNGNEDNIRLFQAYRTGDAKATPIVPVNKRFAENVIEADNPAVSGPDDPRIGNPMLYRVSKGHQGVFCEACHGSTHGIWPNKNDLANDNVAATQLQGHKGTITECSTCHEGDLGSTLGGPHGMHPVGNTRFSNGGHENLAESNKNACRACHGQNGEGTVLSRAAADRSLSNEGRTVQIAKGEMVNCTHCHSNEL
jgi:PKD repeat protein